MGNASDSGRVRYVQLGQVSFVTVLRGNGPSLCGQIAAGGGVEFELIGGVSVRSFQDVNLATNGPLFAARFRPWVCDYPKSGPGSRR
jgi:hypothetical protein